MSVLDWSIISWSFRGILLALAIVAVVVLGVAVWRGSWTSRAASGVVAFVLVLAFVAAEVNAHYHYYREVGDLFGRTAKDEAGIEILDSTDVPETGKVVEFDIPPTASNFKTSPTQVFVPPAWFRTPHPQLPVILMLHGAPGGPADWTRSALADDTADAWAKQHDGVAPILVLAANNGPGFNDDSECVDGPRGSAETYLTVDVPKFVTARLGTATGPGSWAVAGFSEGGNCAIMLALRNPDIFGTFADYSGLPGPRTGVDFADVNGAVRELFGGSQAEFDAHEPAKLLAGRRFSGMAGWFQSAADDTPVLEVGRELAALSKKAGIETCFAVVPSGGHTFVTWTQTFKDSLPWLAARLGLVPMSPEYTRICQ